MKFRLSVLLILFIGTSQLLPSKLHDIHLKAATGKYSTLQQMLKHGIIPDLDDDFGNTPLHYAVLAKNNNVRIAGLLLDAKPSMVDVQNNNGISALHIAVVTGRIRVVKELLKRGANPNLQDTNGVAPMHLATAISFFKNRSAFTNALKPSIGQRITTTLGALFPVTALRTSATVVGVPTTVGATVFAVASVWFLANEFETSHAALGGALAGVLTAAIVFSTIASVVAAVATVGIVIRRQILKQLIEHGGNPNIRDNKNNTPLHILADGKVFNPGKSRSGVFMAKQLLNNGANPALKNNAGLTPYDVARKNNRLLLRPFIKPKRKANTPYMHEAAL